MPKEKLYMKQSKTIVAGAILLLVTAMPSLAMAQYREQRLDNFLNGHPNVKAQLERDPGLIYDKRYREQHPELQQFMQEHPNVWGKLPNNARWGAYGPDHDWHESDWWHQHDPDWMYKNHPEWAENHPDWRGDGDYDEHHEWHDRNWWNANHPDWVNKHHPDWYKHPYEHPVAAEEHAHEEAVQQQEKHHHHDHDNPGGPNNH